MLVKSISKNSSAESDHRQIEASHDNNSDAVYDRCPVSCIFAPKSFSSIASLQYFPEKYLKTDQNLKCSKTADNQSDEKR